MKSPLPFFLISLAVLLCDQVTKRLIQSNLRVYDVINVLPFFNIVYVRNTGSAFGMFKSLGNAFFIMVASAAMAVVAALMVKYRSDRLAFSLILGGAAGNLLDRIAQGSVVDFLDFFIGPHHWPAFNVADSALTVGIMILLVDTLTRKDPAAKEDER